MEDIIYRRDFLKMLGLGATGAAIEAIVPSSAAGHEQVTQSSSESQAQNREVNSNLREKYATLEERVLEIQKKVTEVMEVWERYHFDQRLEKMRKDLVSTGFAPSMHNLMFPQIHYFDRIPQLFVQYSSARSSKEIVPEILGKFDSEERFVEFVHTQFAVLNIGQELSEESEREAFIADTYLQGRNKILQMPPLDKLHHLRTTAKTDYPTDVFSGHEVGPGCVLLQPLPGDSTDELQVKDLSRLAPSRIASLGPTLSELNLMLPGSVGASPYLVIANTKSGGFFDYDIGLYGNAARIFFRPDHEIRTTWHEVVGHGSPLDNFDLEGVTGDHYMAYDPRLEIDAIVDLASIYQYVIAEYKKGNIKRSGINNRGILHTKLLSDRQLFELDSIKNEQEKIEYIQKQAPSTVETEYAPELDSFWFLTNMKNTFGNDDKGIELSNTILSAMRREPMNAIATLSAVCDAYAALEINSDQRVSDINWWKEWFASLMDQLRHFLLDPDLGYVNEETILKTGEDSQLMHIRTKIEDLFTGANDILLLDSRQRAAHRWAAVNHKITQPYGAEPLDEVGLYEFQLNCSKQVKERLQQQYLDQVFPEGIDYQFQDKSFENAALAVAIASQDHLTSLPYRDTDSVIEVYDAKLVNGLVELVKKHISDKKLPLHIIMAIQGVFSLKALYQMPQSDSIEGESDRDKILRQLHTNITSIENRLFDIPNNSHSKCLGRMRSMYAHKLLIHYLKEEIGTDLTAEFSVVFDVHRPYGFELFEALDENRIAYHESLEALLNRDSVLNIRFEIQKICTEFNYITQETPRKTIQLLNQYRDNIRLLAKELVSAVEKSTDNLGEKPKLQAFLDEILSLLNFELQDDEKTFLDHLLHKLNFAFVGIYNPSLKDEILKTGTLFRYGDDGIGGSDSPGLLEQSSIDGLRNLGS